MALCEASSDSAEPGRWRRAQLPGSAAPVLLCKCRTGGEGQQTPPAAKRVYHQYGLFRKDEGTWTGGFKEISSYCESQNDRAGVTGGHDSCRILRMTRYTYNVCIINLMSLHFGGVFCRSIVSRIYLRNFSGKIRVFFFHLKA